MTLDLHVDVSRWRAHLERVRRDSQNLVPVIKGNGYGFTSVNLAREATRLGVSTVAVGVSNEIEAVAAHFNGEILLLTPTSVFGEANSRVILTISSLSALAKIPPGQPFVVEIESPMHRHGILESEIPKARELIINKEFRGFSVHLPIASMGRGWFKRIMSLLPETTTLWVSHAINAQRLAKHYSSITFRERVGTALWLGDLEALRVSAHVLDSHKVEGPAGYRQRKNVGTLLVVSGGTSHGIGLQSLSGDFSLVGRAKVLAKSLIEFTGRLRSPYFFQGKRLNFLEPAHMQCSLLTIPNGQVPAIGDELMVEVRHTTTHFDRVLGLN